MVVPFVLFFKKFDKYDYMARTWPFENEFPTGLYTHDFSFK
jgi:hypothetical protein